ncbi:uncharacterized protein LOC135450341 [Zonotrichia leucophrys gambelii]|uniref:uncharacterized protein LOC135450341 n=1 Tax=Zonotrichia leucophrys gambelii TaxID=257770 RepID=UPI0031403BA8
MSTAGRGQADPRLPAATRARPAASSGQRQQQQEEEEEEEEEENVGPVRTSLVARMEAGLGPSRTRSRLRVQELRRVWVRGGVGRPGNASILVQSHLGRVTVGGVTGDCPQPPQGSGRDWGLEEELGRGGAGLETGTGAGTGSGTGGPGQGQEVGGPGRAGRSCSAPAAAAPGSAPPLPALPQPSLAPSVRPSVRTQTAPREAGLVLEPGTARLQCSSHSLVEPSLPALGAGSITLHLPALCQLSDARAHCHGHGLKLPPFHTAGIGPLSSGKELPIQLQHHPARCASRLCCACSPLQRSFPASCTADHQLHGVPDLALRVLQRLVPWTAGLPPTLSMPFSGAARPSQESLWSLRPSSRHFSSFPNVKRLAICLDPPPAKAARERFFGKA